MVRSRASREEARAFEGATVGRKRMLHNGAVTVRWQGIGCPELRYGRSIWYRQHWGQAPPSSSCASAHLDALQAVPHREQHLRRAPAGRAGREAPHTAPARKAENHLPQSIRDSPLRPRNGSPNWLENTLQKTLLIRAHCWAVCRANAGRIRAAVVRHLAPFRPRPPRLGCSTDSTPNFPVHALATMR